MNQRIRSLAVLLALPFLASCTVDDVVEAFGPRPDSQLVELADLAHADGRTGHADELAAEITRLCGTHADGTVPESCSYTPGEATAADAFTATVDAVDEVPDDSRDLIARQAVQLAGDAELPAVELSTEAAEQARTLLRAEYAAVSGLGTARAFLPAEQVDPLIDAAEHRIDLLREVLSPTGDVPVAEAGYEVAGDLGPADPGFPGMVATELDAAWLTAVRDADDDTWRRWLALVAGRGETHPDVGA